MSGAGRATVATAPLPVRSIRTEAPEHGPTGARAAIVIHDIDHARAALSAAETLGCAVTLVSAPSAGASLGPEVFTALMAAALDASPSVNVYWILDCGRDPAFAVAALAAGVPQVVLDAHSPAFARVRAIAEQVGARVHADLEYPFLDLADVADPVVTCRNWLAEREKTPL